MINLFREICRVLPHGPALKMLRYIVHKVSRCARTMFCSSELQSLCPAIVFVESCP